VINLATATTRASSWETAVLISRKLAEVSAASCLTTVFVPRHVPTGEIFNVLMAFGEFLGFQGTGGFVICFKILT
jgi:hypothetical protein